MYFLPTSDLWVLAVLNAPIGWWFSWRAAQHGKDDALRYFTSFVESYPIPRPSETMQDQAVENVARLITIKEAVTEADSTLRNWLRLEFDVTKFSQRLHSPAALTLDEFQAEVKKGRKGRLTVAALSDLTRAYADTVEPARALLAEAGILERQVSDLVNQAYGLTPEEVELMWRTAPPRMPLR